MNSAFASIHQWQSACSVGIACHGQVADRGSLVIARGNFIEIYEVDNARKQHPLRKRFRIRLEGVPEDMKLCRFPGSKYDSILLSFRPARLSRLDFNPDTYEFETTAMFSYEDPKRKIGNLQDFQPELLAVDPLQRCAVMAVSDCTILAWPCQERVQFGQVIVASDASKSILSSQPTTNANIVVIDLTEYGVKRIKSMAFLNGFLEPSLLILHEPELTWAGRTAVRPATCVITAISINIDSCKHFLIANEKDIFYDSHTILPLAMPIGGALIISCNMVIHYKQKIEFALSLNEFGDQCTSLRVVPTPSKCTPVALDRAVCAALSNDTVLLGACDGELYALTLHTLGDAIRSMGLSKITKTHIASTLCPAGPNLLFLGSKLGDSLLIEYNLTSNGGSGTPSRPLKKSKSDGTADGFDFILSNGLSEQSAAFTVKMRDSLFSISPITKIQVGINNQVTPERSEIVACSGYERTGALTVIDDSVHLNVLASFDLKGAATGIWSAFVPAGSSTFDPASSPMYLIVSMESRTIVRRSENNELKAADNDSFALDVQTLYAGNVFSSLVQITQDEVRILTTSEWKVFGFGGDTKIRYADMIDSYIALLTLDGDILLGEIIHKDGVPELSLQPISFNSQCSAISLYKDNGLSGLFTKSVSKDHHVGVAESETMEDIEALLFGSSASSAPKANQESSLNENPVHLLAVVLSDGSLQILSVPDRTALFIANDCLSGSRLVTNDINRLNDSNRSSPLSACHLLLSTVCDDVSARPSLFISLDNGDLLIYNSFPVTNAPNGHIPLAFARFHHGIITRPLSASGIESRPFAVPFSAVRGLPGVFIGGNRPQWLWGNRDYIHSTAQVAEGVVSAFCSFRSPTFAYCLDNTLRICSLPADICYDLQITVRRIPVRLTPHLLTYHAESGTYALVVLKPAKIDLIEGETDRTVPLYDKRSQMHLCTNNTMKVVDTFKDFEKDDEAILCVEDSPIAYGEKKLHFLSVGTGNIESEEVSCRGRLLLFRVHDTTPSDKTGAGYRYNLAFESKEIGPVSAITAVQGFLCVAVGLRVIMYRWDTDRLVGCAFYDADFYSVSLQSAKGFILLADIYNSAHLLFWEPRLKQIMFLGKDPVRTEVYGSDFLIDGEDLSLAICDGENNLRLIGYAPYQPDSLGGRRLLRRADIHIGTRISSFSRIRGSDLPGVSLSVGSRYPLLGVGIDGSIICLSPVSDTVYRRLYSLTTLMTYQIRHVAGLNPRQFRTWQSTEHGSMHTINVARNIVDLDFLLGFASLDTQQQEKMALGIGSTSEQIVDDLLQLQLAGSLQLYVS